MKQTQEEYEQSYLKQKKKGLYNKYNTLSKNKTFHAIMETEEKYSSEKIPALENLNIWD